MLGNEFRTPVQLFEYILTQMNNAAEKNSFVSDDTYISHELMSHGKACVVSWLCDAEFKSGLEKNPMSYYFGIGVNLIVCGMYYASVWASESEKLTDVRYTDIYKNGLWNNVCDLLEDKTDESVSQFKILARELFDIWVSCVKPYWKLPDAGKYIVDTMVAFFQIGVCIKLSLIGY